MTFRDILCYIEWIGAYKHVTQWLKATLRSFSANTLDFDQFLLFAHQPYTYSIANLRLVWTRFQYAHKLYIYTYFLSASFYSLFAFFFSITVFIFIYLFYIGIHSVLLSLSSDRIFPEVKSFEFAQVDSVKILTKEAHFEAEEKVKKREKAKMKCSLM